MNHLYLVRHAPTRVDPNRHHAEWELDPAGAPLLAQLAKLPHWHNAYRIVSSSEPKAVKTAEYIAKAHQLPPVETNDALKELHKGSFAANHDKAMATLFRYPSEPVGEGWETAQAALTRFTRAVTTVSNAAQGRDVIVLSHGTVLAFFIAHLQGKELVDPREWKAIGIPDFCAVDTETMRVVEPWGAGSHHT